MAGLNKMMIIGNVGADPEMRYTPNGSAVASFPVATNRVYTSADGERHEETEWFTVVAWTRLAETVTQYVVKGLRVYAEGRLRSHKWEGQDGQARFRNEINASQILFLDNKSSSRNPGGDAGESDSSSVDLDDLPF